MGEIFSPSKKTATCQTCLCAFKAHTETLATECRVSDEVIYNTALFSSKAYLQLHLECFYIIYLFIYIFLFLVFPIWGIQHYVSTLEETILKKKTKKWERHEWSNVSHHLLFKTVFSFIIFLKQSQTIKRLLAA